MKYMKKLMSSMLAAVTLLCLTVPALAAGNTGSIIIRDAENVPVANKTFRAYKVMDATMVDAADPSKGIAYTVPEELADFYAARYTLTKTEPDFDRQVTAKIAEEEDMFAFARAVLAAAKQAQILPGTASAGAEDHVVTISNLPLGYYVVEDAGAAAPISALVLDTAGQVEVAIKADKPTIEKKIDGSTDTDPSTEGPVDTNNTAIGDKVPYVLTSAVPDMTGYTKYFFVVSDTLSKGLTFNDDAAVTINGQTVDPGQYTVSYSVQPDGTTAVKLVMKNFLQYQDRAGAPIVITYSATVDTDAVIGTAGNPNEVILEYSHNPNIVPTGENEPSQEDREKKVTGRTPEDVTRTFVTELELTKVNEQNVRLTGAEFELKGTRLNTVIVTREVFAKSQSGTWYLLKDGTYTETAPDDLTGEQYASTTEKYIRETRTETITKPQSIAYKGEVGSDGVLRFTGLAAGEYTITELNAPDGYNMLKEPIQVKIDCELPGSADGQCIWTVSRPASVSEEGVIRLTVENQTGTELPETGGIGTTVFYVVGGLLAAGAVVLLVVRKRIANES